MLEVLRQRFVPEKDTRELSLEAYLHSLTEPNRRQVLQFVKFTQSLGEKLPGVRIGVIAIGSATRPQSERHHPAEDIDLKILNSAPMNSEQQKVVVEKIMSAIKDYLRQEGMKFEESDRYTVETRIVWGPDGDKEELMPSIDWYYMTPFFVVESIEPKEGLPLHISVSGIGSPDLDTHIREERKNRESFSILMESK